ncbi:unnamed protein product [Timema podura]|uniref:60S ribosomal protein L27 n=1 Tax=Timema podura TaxID=61482 RepID=A0ABN7PJQ4_TIMPD|nr:unnamed protein product [Timema podura]
MLSKGITNLDHVTYLKEAKLPKTKPVVTLKRAACDPFLKCKLAFCKTSADECRLLLFDRARYKSGKNKWFFQKLRF